MSWRKGADLFAEMWPLIKARIPDRELRAEFTARLLAVFLEYDLDSYDIEDIDPEIADLLRSMGPWTGGGRGRRGG